MPKKKTSAQWRKNKIEDVEEALEDKMLVDKLKKKSLQGNQESEDLSGLFTVDTKGSFEGLSKTSKRAAARAKIFPPKGPKIGLTAFEECKLSAAENKLEAKKQQKPKPVVNDMFDLWSAPVPAKAAADEAKATASLVKREPEKKPYLTPSTLFKKVSTAPSVLPAHEGQSMNPEASALEDLTFAAAAKQLELERDENVQDRKMRPVTAELTDVLGEEMVREMDEQAKLEAYRSIVCTTGEDAEAEDPGSHLKGSAKIRTKAQAVRNREKRRKTIDEMDRRRIQEKKMAKSIGDIGAMLKEMKDHDQWCAERKKYGKTMKRKRAEMEKKEGVVPKHRKLGKTKFMEEALVIPDAAAASKGLRSMPLSGQTAVRDRVESIMRRGLLPAPPQASTRETKFQKSKQRLAHKANKHFSPLLRDGIQFKAHH